MKSVGEAMAIGRTFKQAFAKALRSRELDQRTEAPADDQALLELVQIARSRALRLPARGFAPRRPASTNSTSARAIDPWFLRELSEYVADPRGGIRRRCGPSRPSTPARPSSPPRRPTSTRPGSAAPSGTAPSGTTPAPPNRARLEAERAAGGRGQTTRRAQVSGPGRDPRFGPQPDRTGDRVRLLLRARRPDGARAGARRGHDQLQPGDGLDRLRHLRPAVLRAADARGRARGLRVGNTRRRGRPVRRPDAAEARRRPRSGRRFRSSAPGSRRSTSPRTGHGSAPCSTAWDTERRRMRPPPAPSRRSSARPRSASRCWCAPATCSAAARWRSSTASTGCATT